MKPSNLLILLFTLLVSTKPKAQNVTLLKNNGREYNVEILQKGDYLIKFRKSPSRDNRVFSVPVKRILAFRYADGKITDATGRSLLPIEFEYEKMMGISQRKMKAGLPTLCVGGTFLAAGICLFSYGIASWSQAAKHNGYTSGPIVYTLGGVVLMVPGIPLTVFGSVLTAKARRLKNEAKALRQL